MQSMHAVCIALVIGRGLLISNVAPAARTRASTSSKSAAASASSSAGLSKLQQLQAMRKLIQGA